MLMQLFMAIGQYYVKLNFDNTYYELEMLSIYCSHVNLEKIGSFSKKNTGKINPVKILFHSLCTAPYIHDTTAGASTILDGEVIRNYTDG